MHFYNALSAQADRQATGIQESWVQQQHAVDVLQQQKIKPLSTTGFINWIVKISEKTPPDQMNPGFWSDKLVAGGEHSEDNMNPFVRLLVLV